MFRIFLKKRISILIWQYLDGAIPADRFEILEKALSRFKWARASFVDSAVLNALLMAYYHPNEYSAVPDAMGMPQRLSAVSAGEMNLDAELAALEADDDLGDAYTRRDRPRRKRPTG